MKKNIYNSQSQMTKKQGFTLLELLVVISIIGILLALGIVAYSTAQQKSRDAKRRGDIKALRDGFEQYYAKEGGYDDCNTMRLDQDIFPGGAPTEPRPAPHMQYECAADATGYCVCAELETGGGNAVDENCSWGDGDYYCLTNLQ